jgi:Zn-finger nucleic acid-binding protein
MIVFGLEGVEIDRCLDCGGTWLDAGELDQIGALAGLKPGRLTAALEKGGGEKHGERRCPRCPGRLRVLKVENVELDRCPHGHGLWFDAKEIETLISAFKEGEEGRVAAFLGDLLGAGRAKGA